MKMQNYYERKSCYCEEWSALLLLRLHDKIMFSHLWTLFNINLIKLGLEL